MFLYRQETARTGTQVWTALLDPWGDVQLDHYDNGRHDLTRTLTLDPIEFWEFERDRLRAEGWGLECCNGPDLAVHLIQSANQAKVKVGGTVDLDLDPTDEEPLLDQADEAMAQHGCIRLTDWLMDPRGVLRAVATQTEETDLTSEVETLVRPQFETTRSVLTYCLDTVTFGGDPIMHEGVLTTIQGVPAADVVRDRIALRGPMRVQQFVTDLVVASRRGYPEQTRQAMALLVEAWRRAAMNDPLGALSLAARASELVDRSRMALAGYQTEPGS